MTAPGSDEPIRGPAGEPSDEPSQPPEIAPPLEVAPPPESSFGRSMGTLWMYTILRFLVFGVLFGLLWLVGAPIFLAAVLALGLSVPLSYVLLARPRAALAETVEARLMARRAHSDELSSRLKGDDGSATP